MEYVLVLIVVAIVVSTIVFIMYIVDNWTTGKKYKDKKKDWWEGTDKDKTITTKQGKVKKVKDEDDNVITEHVDGKRDILQKSFIKIIKASIPLTIIPVLLIVIINNIGTLGMSIVFMVICLNHLLNR